MIYTTIDGGQNWKEIPSYPAHPNEDILWNDPSNLYGDRLTFLDAQTGWLTGNFGDGIHLEKTTDGGLTWQPEALTPPANIPDLFSLEHCFAGDAYLEFLDQEAGLQFGTLMLTCGDWPYNTSSPPLTHWPYMTQDGGQTWRPYLWPVPLCSIEFVSPAVGWCSGADKAKDDVSTSEPSNRQLYQTQDGGQTWAVVANLTWQGQFDFGDEQNGWAAVTSNDGTALPQKLMQTTDGGRTWSELQPRVEP
jgi:photosystem II stability/assembly factor-like uncharacterized protein